MANVPLSGKIVETDCFNFFCSVLGLNKAAACGILANIERESNFNIGAIGDSGTSFGICQWHKQRKSDLIAYCLRRKLNHQTITGQLEYLKYELEDGSHVTGKSYLLNEVLRKVPNTADGAEKAGYEFCKRFERPAGGETSSTERGKSARLKYWPAYSDNSVAIPPSSIPTSTSEVKPQLNLGQTIVEIARSYIGCEYDMDRRNQERKYDENGKMIQDAIFDCSSLCTRCYREAGFDLEGSTSIGIYNHYKNKAKIIGPNDEIKAADLIFYVYTSKELAKGRTPAITHIALANGLGGRVHAGSPVQENDHMNSKNVITGTSGYFAILRVLPDSQTSAGIPAGTSGWDYVSSSGAYAGTGTSGLGPLSLVDIYKETVETNLERVEADGFDFGYLIDMKNGGEFKFYIPEFSESAGSQWSDISIRGRSVSVKTYESTNSRSVTISLDLYAGAGLYEREKGTKEDVVGILHKDLAFLKSLEYPDYSSAAILPPPTVHLILGSAFNLVGVVSNVSVEHKKPFDEQNRAMYASVSFTITQTEVNPPDLYDIRGISRSLGSVQDTSSLQSAESNTSTLSVETAFQQDHNFIK